MNSKKIWLIMYQDEMYEGDLDWLFVVKATMSQSKATELAKAHYSEVSATAIEYIGLDNVVYTCVNDSVPKHSITLKKAK